jgi:hypothetical protein
MDITGIYLWVIISVISAVAMMAGIVMLIIISKKTHAIVEFKSSTKGNPISLFFQDNRYCEWKINATDAGMIEDKEYGSFVIESTYIDKQTKNVLIPFNSSFAMSLNVKAAKMADDLSYVFKEQKYKSRLKEGILNGLIPETDGLDTLRISVNFSAIKDFVSPILPHNITSKIVNTVRLRLKEKASGNLQNIILLIVAALGAIGLGGLVLKFVVFK